ncbi:MAG: phosphatidate cytidylyltransferase [Bacteroidales bacterium]|nr:phosphatidate cytidylyltransferase [Bacteroidales bacterium]
MNELGKRTLTGMLIVAAIVGAALAGKAWFAVLTGLIWAGCCLETVRLFSIRSELSSAMPDVTSGTVACYLLRVFSGILYVTLGMVCLYLLYVCLGCYGLLGFFVLIWSSDIFAYLTGSLLGRHKLCPKISPSKTWEGAMGGFLFAVGLAYVWKIWLLPDTGILFWLVFSVLTIVAGMGGDLLESAVKRKAGVKDSGRFLPGHGGVLDRFDSVLLAAPVALATWFILNWILDGKILFA